jgi:PBP1b-binding outer membrane lipoprotein LpoB
MKSYLIILLTALILSACAEGTDLSTHPTVIGTTDVACADSTGKEIPCK